MDTLNELGAPGVMVRSTPINSSGNRSWYVSINIGFEEIARMYCSSFEAAKAIEAAVDSGVIDIEIA